MIRLGHIEYSNCIPVHAKLLEGDTPGVQLVHDVPSRLNAALAAGEIDVAPCSSIEYARHASEYAVLPGFVIGSAGPVQSILLESRVALRELNGARVALPTASATSVVLLRALLELRLGVKPAYTWFEQAASADPIAEGADAALRIGDVALTREAPADRIVHDLGVDWYEWTRLPFAFAIWQVRRDADPREVSRLAAELHASRRWFVENEPALAGRHAPRYRLSAERLSAYWRSLRFDLDPPMQRGLLHFFRLAAELDEAPHVASLEFTDLA